MTSFLISIDDLGDDDIQHILSRSHEMSLSPKGRVDASPKLVGLLFLEPSLRTRVGFAAAAARLGWQSIDVAELRQSRTSMVEGFEDTLRTVAGYVDIVVARPARPLARTLRKRDFASPFVNGGDTGPTAEHPTQALLDIYSIEQWFGTISDIRLGICGDPRMRSVRSLMLLLTRRRPAWISIFAHTSHLAEITIPPPLAAVVDYRSLPDVDDINVLYVAGIPHASLPLRDRDRLLVTQSVMSRLPRDAIVLSPLPIIDEIDEEARRDRRVRMFWQSDQGLFVRMAVLEQLVSGQQAPAKN
jgi:aspartate carbamoyltransferase catalytic subunit